MTDEEAQVMAATLAERHLGGEVIDLRPAPTGGDSPPPLSAQYLTFNPAKGQLRTFLPEVLGSWLKRTEHLRVAGDGEVVRYAGGVYVPCRAWLAEFVRDNHGRFYRPSAGRDVTDWLAAEVPSVGDVLPHGLLNVANGLLDWRSGALAPHNPEVATLTQVPVPWEPGATCPRFERFLTEALPADAAGLAWEMLGYCLLGDPFLQKAFLLLGPGGNGKTRFLDVVRGLLGLGAFSAITLQALAEERFASADLYGKLANVCGDLDARAVKRSDTFKALVGGDPIKGERKYAHPFKFTPRAVLIFSANEPPASADQSEAWFDRWVILPMPTRFRGTEREDPHLREKLLAELPGIFVGAVEGLRRLVTRGRLDPPASVAEAGAGYQARLDTVAGFLAEETIRVEHVWADRAQLGRAYRRWCAESDRSPVTAASFNERIAALPGVWLSTVAGRPRWNGIGLSDEPRRVGGEHWRW